MSLTQHVKSVATAALALGLSCVLALASLPAFAGSYDDFFVAVRNDRSDQVDSLIKRGFDPNSRDPKGEPGLLIAAREQSSKVLRTLAEQPGIELDALNPAGESALMLAAIKGDLKAASLLLDRGAKVNQPGWSALHYAASGPEPKLVVLLLGRGAAVNAGSPNGTTPLMMAAQSGSEDSVKALLAGGADAKLRNQLGLSAADFARKAERASLAKQLDAGSR